MISKFYGKADGYLEALLVKFLILENPVAVPDSLSSKKTQRLGQKSNDKVKKSRKKKRLKIVGSIKDEKMSKYLPIRSLWENSQPLSTLFHFIRIQFFGLLRLTYLCSFLIISIKTCSTHLEGPTSPAWAVRWTWHRRASSNVSTTVWILNFD